MKAIRIAKTIRATTLKILFGAVATIALVNYLAPAHAQINRTSIPPFPSPSPTPLPADQIIENPALLKLSKPPVGGEDEWGRRGIRLVRADGGVSSGQSCRQVGPIQVCVPWPADDSKALLGNPGDFISGTDARRNGQLSPARLRWIDGSATGFSVELISMPGGYVRVGITIDR